MPRVASESPAVLPSRPALPSVRAHSNADSREAASPFSELLDSATPAAEPPPAPPQARSDRPERPDRADRPKPANDRGSEAKPAQDRSGDRAQDSDNAKDTKDAKAAGSAGETKPAKDSADGKAADGSKDGKATASTGADSQVKPDAEQKAALDAMFVDAAAPAVIVPQAAAATMVVAVAIAPPVLLAATPTEAGTPEAEALAALAAAGQGPRVAPDAATKPGQPQADKPADASAKGAAHGDPQAAVPQIESGKDSQGGNRDKALRDFHHAAADLLTKLDGNAPAQQGGDAAGATKASADAVRNLGVAAPGNTAGAPANPAIAAANPPGQAQAMAVPLSGLAVEITAQAHAGKNHFEIRLDPPDLGRIDVRLDVDRDGNVSTRLVVDRADTLDLLKRDAASLERALQQAGLKTSDHALDFSLRQHAFTHDDTAAQTGTHVIVPDDDPAPLEALRQGYGRLLGLGGGLDIRV